MNIRLSYRSFVIILGLLLSGLSVAGRVQSLPDFTGLVKESRTAVVNISTTRNEPKRVPGSSGDRGFRDFRDNPGGIPFDELLKKFFGDHGGGPRGDGRGFKRESLGSGFIISSDGYVITNRHVVKGADKIIVRLSDRRELEAELVGMDKRSDIALLRLDAQDLPVVKVGDSEKLEAGEWVVAIGSPFGFDYSVTAGIVSAKGRNLPSENYVPFIQTDVAINPGNSGGPLFNMNGEVVGVNSQIFSRTGGYMGLSFAIPIDVAMTVVEQLKVGGKVTRGWLGVYIQDISRELAESFGLYKPEGALITRILPDSPAENSKLRVGDVIVEYDGKPVYSSSSLPPLVGATPVNSKAKLKVIREGKTKFIYVKIGELPDIVGASGQDDDRDRDYDGSYMKRLGISVIEPNKKLKKELGLGDYGILVEKVMDGPARDAGIQKGDLLVMVDGVKLKNIAELKRVVEKLNKGKSIPVLIQRGEGSLFLALKISSSE